MNLSVDIGNSRLKAGVFDAEVLVRMKAFGADDLELFKVFVAEGQFDRTIVSSVSSAFESVVQVLPTAVRLGKDELILPVELDYKTIDTLGNDRIAAVCGAFREFQGHAVLVIDSGTCITYDLLTPDGVFAGGNIAPGLKMRLQAMHDYTDALPLLDLKKVTGIFGRSTEEAMINGATQGILFEIDGYLGAVRQRFNDVVVVATGGDADHFADRMKTEIFVRPNLVLEGLNEILKVNEG